MQILPDCIRLKWSSEREIPYIAAISITARHEIDTLQNITFMGVQLMSFTDAPAKTVKEKHVW